MRVGLITSSYPRFDGDFAGHFVHRSVLRLLARGHEVQVVAPTPDRTATLTCPPGLELHYAPTPPGLFYGSGAPENLQRLGWRAPGLALRASAALALSAKQHLRKAEVIIAHWVLPGALVAAPLAGHRPLMVVAHSSGARMALAGPAPLRFLVARALGRAEVVTATDPELAGALAELRGGPVHWLAPDCGALARRPPEQPVGAERPLTLGFLGRRAPIKGLDPLIRLLESLVERERLPLRLVVGGPLEGTPPLRAAWLEDRGLIDGESAKQRFFADIDLLLVPSLRLGTRQEGLPCVVLEAWSAGVPVLASETGAARWIAPRMWRYASPRELEEKLRAMSRDGLPDDMALSRASRLEAYRSQVEALCYAKLGL